MKRNLWLPVWITLVVVVLACSMPGSLCVAQSIKLDSDYWRFALDRTDVGVRAQWYAQALPAARMKLPGVLQAQGYGDEISTQTPWVLSLYDRFWYLREDYKQYTKPGNVKVPFLSQPPRHYLGAAWYQRDIQIPRHLAGPPHGAYSGAASLGNDRLA